MWHSPCLCFPDHVKGQISGQEMCLLWEVCCATRVSNRLDLTTVMTKIYNGLWLYSTNIDTLCLSLSHIRRKREGGKHCGANYSIILIVMMRFSLPPPLPVILLTWLCCRAKSSIARWLPLVFGNYRHYPWIKHGDMLMTAAVSFFCHFFTKCSL